MSWDLDQLKTLISQCDDYVVTQEEDCLLIANTDGIDAWLAISGEQILVESLLFSTAEVKDASGLNEAILKTHMIFPLSTVGISPISGQEYYVAFGALSSQSKDQSILIEIETLFQNVAGFLDAYHEFLH